MPKAKKGGSKQHSTLAWRHVDLPSEVAAQASAGGPSTTDADFWLGLDADADDFMGLQEVEGVQVRNEEGRVRFEVKGVAEKVDEVAEESAGEEASAEEEEVEKPKSTTTTKKEKAKAKQKERKEKLKATKLASAASGSTSKDAAADAAAASEGEEDDEATALKADFRLLSQAGEEEEFDDAQLPAWSFPLHASLKRALLTLGFTVPTSIQSATLPLSLTPGRDVVGIAQTGSGKTLAYGLPVLQYVLEARADELQAEAVRATSAERAEEEREEEARPLAALILCPTRELALQVSKHLAQLVEAAPAASGEKDPKTRFASVATLTGGMSEEKQRRILNRGRGADVVVATPGRLWDMCQTDPTLTARIQRTRFLVVDEADRMIEAGHFAEMEHILGLVRRVDVAPARKKPANGKGKDKEGAPVRAFDAIDADEFARPEDSAAASAALPQAQGGSAHMQTLIFSATLSKELQRNLKRRSRTVRRKAGTTLEDLLDRIDFRDEDPAVVDLTPERRVASELRETKVECLMKEKDLYLYYFLLRYPGRTIVFINSIDGIRRLLPLLTNLGINAFPLHSQLQQKQRLKHLDRFRTAAIDASASAKGASKGMASVLLATDVAARGLDVPGVDHVVHYQLPRSADAFVHRSGRTARAGRSGVSVALIEPAEKKLWRDLCFSLKRPDDIPALPIEYSFLPDLRARLELSRTIDNAVHNASKAAHEESWLATLASEADIDLDSDASGAESDVDASKKGKKSATKAGRRARAKLEGLRAELEELLRKPMSARGVSHKYLTSGSRAGFVQDLLEDAQHDALIGVKRSTAEDDLDAARAPRKKAKLITAAAAHAAATVPVPAPAAVQAAKAKGGKKKGAGGAKGKQTGRAGK